MPDRERPPIATGMSEPEPPRTAVPDNVSLELGIEFGWAPDAEAGAPQLVSTGPSDEPAADSVGVECIGAMVASEAVVTAPADERLNVR
jgi:hypothetical protein